MIRAALSKVKGDSLGARARRGTFFVVLQFGATNFLRLLGNLVLTRFLFPEAFGLMALVQVVMSGLAQLSDVGIKSSVIQHERGEDLPFLKTAWTLQILRALFLASLVVLAAPFAADFYEEPLLAQLLPVAAIGIVLDGLVPMRTMLAERTLTIGRFTMITIFSQVVSMCFTLVLAWQMQTVWALVYGNIFNAVLRNIFYRMALPGPRDGFAMERAALRDMVSFGAFVFISSVAAYAINLGDRAILGKFVELDLLGIYSIAVALGTIPLLLSGAMAYQIVFPLYSRRPPDKNAEDRRKLFKARYALTGALFGISLIVVLFVDPVVRLLYDPRYELAGGIAVLVAMGSLVPLVVASYASILLANGRTGLNALLVVIGGILRLSAIYIGLMQFGLIGVTLAPIVATILYYPFMVAATYRYRAWDPVHDLVFAVLACVIFALGWMLNGDAIQAVLAS